MTQVSIDEFYPLTPSLSKKLREADLSAAEWRFWAYLTEQDPWGDRYKELTPIKIMTECGMSKSTYYRAKAKFQELELFDFQEDKVSFRNLTGISKMRQKSQKSDKSLKNETRVSKMRQESQKSDKSLKNETRVSKMRQKSQKSEDETSQPSPCKVSKTPQTIQTCSDSYKTNQTLSKLTRERNLAVWQNLEEKDRREIRCYARSVAIPKLPIKPTLEENWIASHCDELSNQSQSDFEFQKSYYEMQNSWQNKSFGNSPVVENQQLMVEEQNKSSANSPVVENQQLMVEEQNKSSANSPAVENQQLTVEDLQRMYGANWKAAAAHFGLEVEEEIW